MFRLDFLGVGWHVPKPSAPIFRTDSALADQAASNPVASHGQTELRS